MQTESKTAATRMSADERREEILEAAVAEFAINGLNGTSTETIAERVGVSQPYLFRLYGHKKDLFLAAIERGFDRIEQAFREASAEKSEETVLERMARAYIKLLSHREELLLQMQGYAACADPEVQAVVRRRFAEIYELVEEASGATDDEVRSFTASGMLLNVAASIDMPSLLRHDWARKCLGMELRRNRTGGK